MQICCCLLRMSTHNIIQWQPELHLLLLTTETNLVTGGADQNWLFSYMVAEMPYFQRPALPFCTFRPPNLFLSHKFPTLCLQGSLLYITGQHTATNSSVLLIFGTTSHAHITQPVLSPDWLTDWLTDRWGFLNYTHLPPSYMQVLILVGKVIFCLIRICHCHVCAMHLRDVRRADAMLRHTWQSKGGRGTSPGTTNTSVLCCIRDFCVKCVILVLNTSLKC